MKASKLFAQVGARGRVTSKEFRQIVFEIMRSKYFDENHYARDYVDSVGGDKDKMPSDHTAIRLSNPEAFGQVNRFLQSIAMESYDGGDKEFKRLLDEAVISGKYEELYKAKWPYSFPDKALISTHFDVAGDPLLKGIEQKIFVSMIDPNAFPPEVRELILEDWKMFSNSFSEEGKKLITKLEKEGGLSEDEADFLAKDWMEVFSTRQIPIKASTFEAIKNAKILEVKKSFSAIPAIGMAFSGVRNHHTLMTDYKIATLPQELEKIGVPPGSPPVQFDGPIVQTSSQGVPQQMRLLDDSSDKNKEKIKQILALNLSHDEKRKMLQDAGLIIERTVNHEYVEYIKRAQMAVVDVDGKEEVMPVWQFEDGRTVSARSCDQDREGLLAGKYANGFDSYQKEVKVEKWLFDSLKRPVLAPGFTANNATNIFLGTSVGGQEAKEGVWSKAEYKVGTKGYNVKYAILATVEGEIQPVFVDEKGDYFSAKRDARDNLKPLERESVEEIRDENMCPVLAEGFSVNHNFPNVLEMREFDGKKVERVQMALVPNMSPTAIPVFVTKEGIYSARATDELAFIREEDFSLCCYTDEITPILAWGYAVNEPSPEVEPSSSSKAASNENNIGVRDGWR